MTGKPSRRKGPRPDTAREQPPRPPRPYALLLPVTGGKRRPPGKPVDITRKPQP